MVDIGHLCRGILLVNKGGIDSNVDIEEVDYWVEEGINLRLHIDMHRI